MGDVDRRTDTNLKRLCDFSFFLVKKKWGGIKNFILGGWGGKKKKLAVKIFLWGDHIILKVC